MLMVESQKKVPNSNCPNSDVDEFVEEVEEMECLMSDRYALNLIFRLSLFEEALRDSYVNLEPSLLVTYLFELCSDTSKALAHLGVKDAPDRPTARQRLALFAAAKSVLSQGLRILGIVPLDKM